jgi:hypothetical protein
MSAIVQVSLYWNRSGCSLQDSNSMTTSVRQLLESFDRLSEPERHEAAAEILRRVNATDLPPLDDDALTEIAAMTFRELDEREVADESTKPR